MSIQACKHCPKTRQASSLNCSCHQPFSSAAKNRNPDAEVSKITRSRVRMRSIHGCRPTSKTTKEATLNRPRICLGRVFVGRRRSSMSRVIASGDRPVSQVVGVANTRHSTPLDPYLDARLFAIMFINSPVSSCQVNGARRCRYVLKEKIVTRRETKTRIESQNERRRTAGVRTSHIRRR